MRRKPAPTRPSGLRVGIDATCLGSWRGYGRFLRELLSPLVEDDDGGHEYLLFVDRHTARTAGPLPARTVEPRTSAGQADAASAEGHRSLLDMLRMSRAVARESLDVMYFPSVYSYFPVPGRVPVVVGLHDTIAERYGKIVFPSRLNRWLWNAKVGLARRRSSGIITPSEWSRQSLAEVFGFSPERIFVTTPAPSPVFHSVKEDERRRRWLAARALPEDCRYFIYVGGFNPHKNLGRLVEAFASCVSTHPDRELGLLMVGDYEGDNFHADVSGLRGCIADLGIGARVHFLGFVPDEELRFLYAGAIALVIPSLEEGFGLPAVEAAACGTPCVATCNSPLPQLLEKSGLFIEPTDLRALSVALESIAGDRKLREELAATALERSRALTWHATAEATRRALESVAGRRR